MLRVTRLLLVCFAMLAAGAHAADRYWIAAKAGNWSDSANWSAVSGGAGGAGVPGAGDAAIFDGKGLGDSTLDAAFAGKIGAVRVLPGYTGTVTQDKDLLVSGDVKIAGGSRVGWTFAQDKPAGLIVKGSLTVAPDKFMTCTRSSVQGEGKGRIIKVRGNLLVDGFITADGKGFMKGPGTPILPVAKDDPNVAQIEDRYVGGANTEAIRNAAPVSPAGPGHGGRGAGIYRNPNGQFTAQPHSYYWTEPLGSGQWVYPGGGTYGSITAPTSLGSGTADDPTFDPKKPYPYDQSDTFWTHKGAYGGGAIEIIVNGTTTVNGKITANGALAGETGASGGSVYLVAANLTGGGTISANGSDGPGHGHGRGGGGGGRVSVVLTKSTSTGVKLQAYGGEGRWSPSAAAGTIYIEVQDDKTSQGTLIIDNNNKPCRSMYDICTSICDAGPKSYSFKSVALRNHSILYVGKGITLRASAVAGENGNLLIEGKSSLRTSMTGLTSQETARPQNEATRKLGDPVTVFTFGPAYTLRQELLNRSFQLSSYPYMSRIVVAGDLSTYAYQEDVSGVKSADVEIVRKGSGAPIARFGHSKLNFNAKHYAEATIDMPELKDGVYEVRITLDNGAKPNPLTFTRDKQAWEHNTLGVTDKIYYPFEPLSVDGNDVRLSSQRVYTMNGFGLFDKIVSEGKDISAGPMTLKLETANGIAEWTFGEGKFTSVKPGIAEYSAHADAGALKVAVKSTIEFDGCAKVEMDLLPGSNPQEVQRLWIEIPLSDKEMPLFHTSQFTGMRWNYAGKTPKGGKIVWEPSIAQWKDRRPPLWSVAPGTEGRNDGVIWDSTNVRNVEFSWANPFVPYIWLGGVTRGLAWFADSDKGWIPDLNKPAQVITREGDKLVMRVYLINKPATVTEQHHLVFGLQASPTRPLVKDWRVVDRFPGFGYMTPPFGMWCCTKFPLDHDYSLIDKAIQNGKDQKAGKPVTAQFVYDKVDELKAKGWPADMTADSYIAHWVKCAWNPICTDGPLAGIYYEEHWTDPGETDVDTFGDEWSAREFTGYWSIREKNRVVYDSPYTQKTGQTGKFLSVVYTDSLVDLSVYYANELLKRDISLYFDNTFPKTSLDTNVSDAHYTEDGRIQPALQIWKQRDYYRRIWNMVNDYNEKGMARPLTFGQHMTNTMILPWNEWTTCNLDNENVWTDVARNIKPAAFPSDYLLTETVGKQVGVPAHTHYSIGGGDGTPRREWGMRRVHDLSGINVAWDANVWPPALDKAFFDFGYGRDDVQVYNFWTENAPFKVSNDDVKWLGLVRKESPSVWLVLQSYSFDPTSTKVALPGYKAWMNAETGELVPVGADGSLDIKFTERYGTVNLVGAPDQSGLVGWVPINDRTKKK